MWNPAENRCATFFVLFCIQSPVSAPSSESDKGEKSPVTFVSCCAEASRSRSRSSDADPDFADEQLHVFNQRAIWGSLGGAFEGLRCEGIKGKDPSFQLMSDSVEGSLDVTVPFLNIVMYTGWWWRLEMHLINWQVLFFVCPLDFKEMAIHCMIKVSTNSRMKGTLALKWIYWSHEGVTTIR